MPRSRRRVPRQKALHPASADSARPLLDRILATPHLAEVVPHLRPEILHRVIESCGLESCTELVSLATPAQIAGVMDVDLWRPARPGLDEELDPERFGVWLEVLLECGECVAAEKIAGIDAELIIAALSRHIRVFDGAAAASYETLDGHIIEPVRRADREASPIGGYIIEAKRTAVWEPLLSLLAALESEQPDCFHRIMRGCRALSDSAPEIDGLDDLLTASEQDLFDLTVERELRRAHQGFTTPAQARGFLQTARHLDLAQVPAPTLDPIAQAYFRDVESPEPDAVDTGASTALADGSPVTPTTPDTAAAVAAISDLLAQAGIVADGPRALLGPSDMHNLEQSKLQACMQQLLDNDDAMYSQRTAELAYLANALMAGCSIQTRPFTASEAADAVHAICNLGLDNWPQRWRPQPNLETGSDELLLHHQDLIGVFQAGWAILYRDVCMFAAERLADALETFQISDRELQIRLDKLRLRLLKSYKAGTPWHVRDDLDVIISLDPVAWAVLLGLIDECPVLHAAIHPGARRIKMSDFQFVSDNRQIALIREFMDSLVERLTQ